MSDAKIQLDPVKELQRTHSKENRLVRSATYASATTASILIAAKLVAWVMTDSVAILSSLIDSLLDLGASLVTFFAVRQSLTPADSDHRFGHGKAEPLAALVQAGFIAASAVLLIIQAVDRLIVPEPIHATTVGVGVMLLSIVATLGLVAYQRFVIARASSIAVEADSAHYAADLLANIAVIAALLATTVLDIPQIDPIFGICIALYIAHGAWGIAMDAFDMLMDKELPDEDREKIKEIALSYSDVQGVHDLRTRRSGPDLFIQMHLDFNGGLTLNRVHSVADAVEKEIMEAFKGAEVIVHEDPVTPQVAHEAPAEFEELRHD